MQSPKSLLLAIMTMAFFAPGAQAEQVSENKAAEIAAKMLRTAGKPRPQRRPATGQDNEQAPTPYYIYTGDGGKGFVIVSGDDIARPILGFSPDAPLTADGELPAPMQQWLRTMEQQIREAEAGGLEQTERIAAQWRGAGIGDTIVLLQTADWGQETPFNNRCPIYGSKRTLAGCVPIAYSILMRYYEYPERGTGRTTRYQTQTRKLWVNSRSLDHTYDWANMPLKYERGSYTSAQSTAVSTLVADVGAALQVDYTEYNTNGFLGRDCLLTNFDFHPGRPAVKNSWTAADWEEMMKRELDQQRPIVYRAEDEEAGGHAFLLDGYTDQGYFRVNWGWDGDYNGMFVLDAMTPPNGFQFQISHVAYLGTVPMPMSEAAYEVSLQGEPYPTLTAAIDAVPTDGTPTRVELLGDLELEFLGIPAGSNVQLDLCDHDLEIQYGIYNNGTLVVNCSPETSINSYGNCAMFENYGQLHINGAKCRNIGTNVYNGDYRRCLWSDVGSETELTDVTFDAPAQVVCTNGKLTVHSGNYTGRGNEAVLCNYSQKDTLVVEAGTFLNMAREISGQTDYRRCMWTCQQSKTVIGQARFANLFGSQTLCFNGDAIIDGADIENNSGRYGMLTGSDGEVKILDCRLRANEPLRAVDNSSIICYAGLYSAPIDEAFLAPDRQCVENPDPETNATYPYIVQEDPTGIATIPANGYGEWNIFGPGTTFGNGELDGNGNRSYFGPGDQDGSGSGSSTRPAGLNIYDLQGRKHSQPQPGINILRNSAGATRKVVGK